MPIERSLVDASRIAVLVAALCMPACGGGVDAGNPDAGPRDSVAPGAADATTCADACGAGTIDAMQEADATDASVANDASAAPDTPEEIDWPAVTRNEICHIVWPHPPGFQDPGNIGMPLVVDPSGNTYVELPLDGNLQIDLDAPRRKLPAASSSQRSIRSATSSGWVSSGRLA
jgi:hypothetical protein